MDAIEKLHGRKTLVIVAHRLTTLESCDEIYRVENKKFNYVTREQFEELKNRGDQSEK